jgi:hypothetical protein
MRNAKLELRSGRVVQVCELWQWLVYEGLLEGLPTREMNRREIERIAADERWRHYGAAPIVLPPNETPIPYHDDRPYPFGEPARLPAIVCGARLESAPARDASMHLSGLCVVWFQPDFAFPIDPEALEHLRGIDWERHAIDMEY